MTDQRRDPAEPAPPLLTEPVAATGELPVLTDAVAETVAASPGMTPEAVDALRDTLVTAARALARECAEQILAEARAGLEQRLAGQFDRELEALVERALRAHLPPAD